jgi:hypothetical protein
MRQPKAQLSDLGIVQRVRHPVELTLTSTGIVYGSIDQNPRV